MQESVRERHQVHNRYNASAAMPLQGRAGSEKLFETNTNRTNNYIFLTLPSSCSEESTGSPKLLLQCPNSSLSSAARMDTDR